MDTGSIISKGTGLWVALACAAAFVSAGCQDDEWAGNSASSGQVSFRVEMAGGWNAAASTRSVGGGVKAEPAIAFKEGELWAVPVVEPQMDSTLFDAPIPQTRGAIVTEEHFYDAFTLYGYVYEGDASEEWTDVCASATTYIDNATVEKKSGSGTLWTTTPACFWPAEQYAVKFFAYAPQQPAGSAVTIGDDCTPRLSHAVPAEAARQQDIVVANPAAMQSGKREAQELKFEHILTAVKIKATGHTKGKITRVALKNVYTGGTFDFGRMEWSGVTESKTGNFEQRVESTGNSGEEDSFVIDGEQTFMMLPQALDEKAELEIEIDGQTLSAPIGGEGKEWKQGTAVVYNISYTPEVTEYIFELGVSTPLQQIEFTYQGIPSPATVTGYVPYTITSYKRTIRGDNVTTEPLEWNAEFSVDGEEWSAAKPGWLSTFTSSGKGSVSATAYDAGVDAQKDGTIVNEHNEVLQSMVSINSSSGKNPYNLANSRGDESVENTANCYLVNAPGTYSLPLVYGNAIKDGMTNEGAYKVKESVQVTRYVMKTFINHLEKGIAHPYIADNEGCNPSSAALVWQDRKGLVTHVSLKDDKTLVFEVPKASIGQGNALIAVKDDKGNILWSWHIWVTDYRLGEDLKSLSMGCEMMPVNLGWCDAVRTDYAKRVVQVRFTQSESNQTLNKTITQLEGTEYGTGYATYYQWGRKDPLVPAVGEGQNHVWYDAEGNESTELVVERVDNGTGNTNRVFATWILHPDKFVVPSAADFPYKNLWAVNHNTQYYSTTEALQMRESDKSVYDPSPVGYKMPVINVYTAFSVDNGTFHSEQGGWTFQTQSDEIFIPVLGSRNFITGVLSTDTWDKGYMWSCTPLSGSGMFFDFYHLLQYDEKVVRVRNNTICYGYSVRSVKE